MAHTQAGQAETPQSKMQAKLAGLGIPAKEIKVYGRQIMVTCGSGAAARQWMSVLYDLASKVRVGESLQPAKRNRGTCLHPTQIKVWRVWATT